MLPGGLLDCRQVAASPDATSVAPGPTVAVGGSINTAGDNGGYWCSCCNNLL